MLVFAVYAALVLLGACSLATVVGGFCGLGYWLFAARTWLWEVEAIVISLGVAGLALLVGLALLGWHAHGLWPTEALSRTLLLAPVPFLLALSAFLVLAAARW